MKTQIRTFITVSSLVFAGVLSANATVNFEEKNSGLIQANESLTVLNEKIPSFENELNGSIDYGKEAQLMIKSIADQEEAKTVQKVMERGFVAPSATINSSESEAGYENNAETTDFREEAQLMIKSIADQEEAKTVQKVMERGFVAPNGTINSSENEAVYENNAETTDFSKEAQLMIKSIADQEEAKVVLKVMERGFVAPSATISSSENEAGYENNVETTDFRKEAQLMIKSIADQEEAKVVQNVMERGFVAPSATISSSENEAGYENNVETTDFRKEAQLMIKLIADQEEAKVVQKVTAEDILAESK